jgi:hypothetical protein
VAIASAAHIGHPKKKRTNFVLPERSDLRGAGDRNGEKTTGRKVRTTKHQPFEMMPSTTTKQFGSFG